MAIPAVHIQRNDPIFHGGSDPHTVQGSLPSFGQTPSVGAPSAAKVAIDGGGGGISSGPAPKTMSAQQASQVYGEQQQRSRTPFAGTPGPVKRELGAQGYDTTDNGLLAAQGYNPNGSNGGPNIQGVGQSIRNIANGVAKKVGGIFSGNPEEKADADRRYRNFQEDSAAVANARKYNK